MKITLWYLADPKTVRIGIEDVCRDVSGTDIFFNRGDQGYQPEFIRKLFQIGDILQVLLSGKTNDISLSQGRHAKPWSEILPGVLVFIRDTFAPQEQIILTTIFGGDRSLTSDDLQRLPDQRPFGDTVRVHRQKALALAFK